MKNLDDLYHLVELLDNFTGQNWRQFTDFVEEETGETITEDQINEWFAELKKLLE